MAIWAREFFDLAGIVYHRNTIPGDKSALRSTGIRLEQPGG